MTAQVYNLRHPFYFLVPFWGQRYREYFVNFCLPSLLAANNLPLLNATDGHCILIATTLDDWRAIENLPIMRRIRPHVRPKLLEIPEPQYETSPGSSSAIQYLNICQKKLLEAAYRERCYGCLLWPDFVISDGMVASLLDHAKCGRHLVLASALRQSQESIIAELTVGGHLSKDVPAAISAQPISLAPRELARLQVCYLHSEVEMAEEGSGREPFSSPFRYWKMPRRDGIILYAFLLHPMLMDFTAVSNHDTKCMEHDFFENVYLGRNFYSHDVYVVQDSDEFGILSLTPDAINRIPPLLTKPPPKSGTIATFLQRVRIRASMHFHARLLNDPLKRDIFLLPISWHTEDLNEEWTQQVRRTNAILNRAIGDYYAARNVSSRDFPPRRSASIKYFILDSKALYYFASRLPLYKLYLWAVWGTLTGDSTERRRILRRITKILQSFSGGAS
jgi:hypothetical protein